MKNYILIFFIIFSAYIADAQNYQTIKHDGVYLFNNTYNQIKAIQIDSFDLNFQDTLFYNFFSIRHDGINHCYKPNGPSWIGKHVYVKSNGDNIFFNYLNDSIIIKTQAVLNQHWKCYTYSNSNYIDAAISSVDTLSFLGVVDSVKTISLQLKDSFGATLTNLVNNYKIKISKNHGLIVACEFYTFPDNIDSLIIIGGPNLIGKSNLTFNLVFDYNVGDEFHTQLYETYPMGYTYSKTKFSIIKIIDKFDITQDSVTYTYSRCEKEIIYNNGNLQVILHNDTVTATIIYLNFNDSYFRHLPEETIFSDNNNGMADLSLSFAMNKRLKKTLPPNPDMYNNSHNDTCWEVTITDGCETAESYIEGCGGPYYECTNGLSQYYNKLLYYKKGIEQWGTPLNCAILMSIDKEDFIDVNNAIIFPNPITESSKLFIKDIFKCPYIMQIYDITGKLIDKKIITAKETNLNLKNINKGLYYTILVDKNGNTIMNKIIVE